MAVDGRIRVWEESRHAPTAVPPWDTSARLRAAENRLLREALSRMLLKSGEVEVVGTDLAEPFQTDDLLKEEANILLLSSRGTETRI